MSLEKLILDGNPSASAQRAQRFSEIMKSILMEKDYVTGCIHFLEGKITILEEKIDLILKLVKK